MAEPRSHAEMLPGSVRLGRLAGVPIGLHFSWLIIAALITFSLADHFRRTYTAWSSGTVWTTSLMTAALFFVTVIAHELSHAVTAKARGLPVRSITLFALGGVAHIAKEANTALTEFLVGAVGPVTSFAIGVVCLAVASAAGWEISGGGGGVTGAVLGWLGSINIMLALFNLIPGYPLDGGRVLKAVLWWRFRDADRATRTAARVGQFVAGLFIALGIFQFFTGIGAGGLWLAFIGWFLLMAAQASEEQLTVTSVLRDVRVGDLMTQECSTVDPRTSVQSIVDDVWLRTARRCVVVQTDGHLLGLVTPQEVQALDRAKWPAVTASDVMRRLPDLQTVAPDTSAADALQAMARHDVNQLPVVNDGRFEGMVSRGQLLQLIQSHKELRA